MGTVFEAQDHRGRRVALKLVHPHLIGKDGFRERFLREAEIGRRIAHPNVVQTLDAGEIDGQPYIALEFVVGQSLHAFRKELGRVPETLCRHIGQRAARGLAAIHAVGIVHRDVKPDNILITPDHEVRLMDLGLARTAEGLDRVTRTGLFLGSPSYSPPEQFRGTGVLDARSDLYSLGATLYELATGERPFRGGSLEVLAGKVMRDPPPRPVSICAEISPFFEALLLALLAKEPARRLESAEQLAEVLEQGESSDWWSSESTRIVEDTRVPLRRIRIPRENACIGREVEVAELLRAFDAAKSGDGRVVLLEGEAGVGKTRLIDELTQRLEARGEDIEFLYGAYPPGGAAVATGPFVEAFGEQLRGETSVRYLVDAPTLAPAFDALLRGDLASGEASPLTPDAQKTAFVHVARSLAQRRPTVVAIDDLHFAPDEGRALFASLAMAVPGHRVLLIGAAREGLSKEWRADVERLEHVVRVAVNRLSGESVANVLGPIVGMSLDSERLAARISTAADGNPFFLFEIVRSLREAGVLSQEHDGSWATVSHVHELVIPATIQSLLEARVARLIPEERELLECAACWGTEFDGRLIAEAMGLRSLPALRILARVEQEHGLVRAVGGRFVFDHHAIQEHLDSRLPDAVREELHAALAEALETRTQARDQDAAALDGDLCVNLCEHFLRGKRGVPALRYLSSAMASLARSYRHEQLVTLAERALATAGLLGGAQRADTLLKLAATLDQTGARERQAHAAREAGELAEAAGDDALRRGAAAALGRVLWRTARHAEAEPAARRALELAAAAGDGSAVATELGNLGNVLKSCGRADEARALFERQMVLGGELGDVTFEARAAGSLGNLAFAEGRFDGAHDLYQRALALSGDLGDLSGEAAAFGNLGNVLYSLGRFDAAREHVERQLELTRRIGDRGGEARATGALAIVVKGQGLLAEAPAHHERALALSREIGYPLGEAVALVNLGSTRLDLGDLIGAREALDGSLALCRRIGARYPEGYALLTLGRVADEDDDAGTAVARIQESLELRREIRHGDGVASSLIELADCRRRIGDDIGALDALDEALALSREQVRKPQIALALAIRAGLPGGDAAMARRALVDAGESADSVRLRYLLWSADGSVPDLHAANSMLIAALANVREPHRGRMQSQLRVHREVSAAWRAYCTRDDANDAATLIE